MDALNPIVALPPPLPPLEPVAKNDIIVPPGTPPIDEAVMRALGTPEDPLPPLNATPAGVAPAPDLAWRCIHGPLTPEEKYDCDAVKRGDLTRAQVKALRAFNATPYHDETVKRVVHELSNPDRIHFLRRNVTLDAA